MWWVNLYKLFISHIKDFNKFLNRCENRIFILLFNVIFLWYLYLYFSKLLVSLLNSKIDKEVYSNFSSRFFRRSITTPKWRWELSRNIGGERLDRLDMLINTLYSKEETTMFQRPSEWSLLPHFSYYTFPSIRFVQTIVYVSNKI